MLPAALRLATLLLAAAEPAAPPVYVKDPFAPEDRARLRQLLQWPQDCEDDHQAAAAALELSDGRVRFLDLSGRRYLAEVGCARASYQEVYRYFLLDESVAPPTAQALKLPGYALDDDDAWQPAEQDEAAGRTAFDPKKKTLTVTSLARGLGDCGTRAVYRADVKAGKLVLVELRGRACDAEPDKAPPPEQWPRVFPPSPPAKPR